MAGPIRKVPKGSLMKNSETAASLRSNLVHVSDMLRSYPGLPEIHVFGPP